MVEMNEHIKTFVGEPGMICDDLAGMEARTLRFMGRTLVCAQLARDAWATSGALICFDLLAPMYMHVDVKGARDVLGSLYYM